MVWREGEVMIKLWTGIEKEGIGKKSEVMTLFVCSDCKIPEEIVIEALESNKNIKRVYFGAGREAFYGMENFIDFITVYCTQHDIKIIIEVSAEQLKTFVNLYDEEWVTFVVAFYDFKQQMKGKLLFKTDDWITTKMFKCKKKVDITCVDNNMYPGDKLIHIEP